MNSRVRVALVAVLVAVFVWLGSPANAMAILVKTIDNMTIQIEVEVDGSIATVKQRIFLRTGIPVAQQRLTFQGRVLDDNATVVSSGIHKESTLRLVSISHSSTRVSAGELVNTGSTDPLLPFIGAAGALSFGLGATVVVARARRVARRASQ